MRCWESYFLWYVMPKSSTTSVNMIFILVLHSPYGIIAGSYPNESRYSLGDMCTTMPT